MIIFHKAVKASFLFHLFFVWVVGFIVVIVEDF